MRPAKLENTLAILSMLLLITLVAALNFDTIREGYKETATLLGAFLVSASGMGISLIRISKPHKYDKFLNQTLLACSSAVTAISAIGLLLHHFV